MNLKKKFSIKIAKKIHFMKKERNFWTIKENEIFEKKMKFKKNEI